MANAGAPCKRQGAGGDPVRITLRCHTKRGEGALQDGQHVMHPGVGLGLAQVERQAVHGLQWMGLVIDEDEEQRVFYLRQNALRAAARMAWTPLALPGLVGRITYGIGRSAKAGSRRANSSCVRPVAARTLTVCLVMSDRLAYRKYTLSPIISIISLQGRRVRGACAVRTDWLACHVLSPRDIDPHQSIHPLTMSWIETTECDP